MPTTLDYHTAPGKGSSRVEGAGPAITVPTNPGNIDQPGEHHRDEPDPGVRLLPVLLVTLTPPTSTTLDGPIVTQHDPPISKQCDAQHHGG